MEANTATLLPPALDVQKLTPDDVMSVYVGKNNRCCCGCSGSHRYSSKNVELASKDRGYDVGPKEINDRQVLKVLRLVQAEATMGNVRVDPGTPEGFVTNVVSEVGEKVLILYLVPGK